MNSKYPGGSYTIDIISAKVLVKLYQELFSPDEWVEYVRADIKCNIWYEGELKTRGDLVWMIGSDNLLCDQEIPLEYDKLSPEEREGLSEDIVFVEKKTKEIGQKLAQDIITKHPLPWKAFAGQIVGDKLIYGIAT